MKKAIVTGANGFIGNYLVHELVNNGTEVWGVVRNTDNAGCFDDINVHIVTCDLTDISSLSEKIEERGYDVFFHLAWDGVSGEKREDYQLQLSNAEACANAAKIAADLSCRRFIGMGSITEKMFVPFVQKDGTFPDMFSCYAVCKSAAQSMSKCVCNKNEIDFVWAYAANVYGVNDRSSNIINYVVKKYLANDMPTLTQGTQKADFIYVSDLAKALVAIAAKGKTMNTYYVGYGNPRPLAEYIKVVHDKIKPECASGIGECEFNGIDVDFEAIDLCKLCRETGFKPQISFEEGIDELITWLKTQKNDSRSRDFRYRCIL